jgi:hypothetical protein
MVDSTARLANRLDWSIQDVENMSNGDRVRVIYVTGYGRSGSTLLDILLGSDEEVLGAGELANLATRVWPRDEYCACGARVGNCAFWRAAVEQWNGRAQGDAVAAYSALQHRVEGRWLRGRRSPHEVAEYHRLTAGLFSTLAAVSGKRVIVDSSKLPARGLALAEIPEIDLRVIHLIRDGRGVAWSLLKPRPKHEAAGLERPLPARTVTRTAVRWALANLLAERLCAKLGSERAVRVRYEDLVATPQPILHAIGAVVGVDLEPLARAVVSGRPLRPQHQVAGNRLRMASQLSLRPDQEWTALMPARKKWSFQLMCGHLLRRYGYA